MSRDLFKRIKTIRVKLINKNRIKAQTKMVDPHHRIKVIIIVDKSSLEILDIEAKMMKIPYQICLKTIPKIKRLKGARIQEGFYKRVKEVIGGREGCIHLVDLIMDTARGIFQMALKIMTSGMKKEEQKKILMEKLKNSCLGYKEEEGGNEKE